jgi:hypothetical protein
MAGLRHHHIPQCLLRGWSGEDGPRGERVRQFRRDSEPMLCSTRDVAVSTRFYSQSIDDEITKLETVLAPTIAALRREPSGAQVSRQIAETLIVHLAMRSGFVRSEIERMLGDVLAGVASKNNDPDFMASVIAGVEQPGFGAGLLEFIQAKLRELPPDEQTDETRAWSGDRSVLAARLREAAVTPADFTQSLEGVVMALTSALDAVARSVHLQLVGDILGAKSGVPALRDFAWSIEAADEKLILPDCIAIWIGADPNASQPYIFSSLTDAPTVIMPLASDRFLLGQRAPARPVSRAGDLNRHLAGCARTLFVAHPDHLAALELAGMLGVTRNAFDDAIAPALAYIG